MRRQSGGQQAQGAVAHDAYHLCQGSAGVASVGGEGGGVWRVGDAAAAAAVASDRGRYVFGKAGRREDSYSRVIAIAHDMKDPDQSFTSYVQECGGIEEVRRVPKAQKSSTMSKDDYKKLALDGLADVQVGVSTFELPTFIQPNTDYEEDYAVALVRCHDNGTGTIVYGCNEAGVIDAVLVSSGKDLDQRAQDSKAQVDAGDLAARRARDVREFTAKMISVNSVPNATVNGSAVRANGAATSHYG